MVNNHFNSRERYAAYTIRGGQMKSELNIAKSLWRDFLASASIADAERFLRLIQRTDPNVEWPLWIAFILILFNSQNRGAL